VRSVGPTSFFPLVCGAASAAQVAQLMVHLDDPATFAGRYGLPSVARNDPAYGDNSYWRGRIWPPLNFLVWHGLRRNGLIDRASRMARDSHALFRQSWDGRRLCPENFNADTGEALDQADTEGFYGWGVLLPMMAVGEIIDVSPWGGWEIDNSGDDVALGPVQSPIGAICVERRAGRLVLRCGDRAVLATDVPGRLSQLRLEPGHVSLTLPACPAGGCSITLADLAGRHVVLARVGDRDLAVDADGRIGLPAMDAPGALLVAYR
jgi:putative isomerase